MYPLPENTLLGQLDITEVYIYYDRPVFFACRNSSDHLFIAIFVHELEQGEIWIYVPVSPRRLVFIRSGGIEIRRAFSQPEDDFVYKVVFPYDDSIHVSIEYLAANDIPPEWLPAANEFLSLKTDTLPALTEKPAQKALQAKREVLEMLFDFIGRTRTEASAKPFGNALVSFQELLNTIGAALRGSEATKGAIPISVINNTEMLVDGMGAGSFKVELIAAQLVDLFNKSEAGDVLSQAFDLMSHQDDVDALHAQIEKLNTRVVSKYLSFLKAIDGEVNRAVMDWGSPDPSRSRSIELTSNGITQTIKVIEQTEDVDIMELKTRGQLIGANVEDRRFEIKIPQFEYNVEGKVMEEAFEVFRNATMSAFYEVTIRETTRTKVMTGEFIRDYSLTSMRLSTNN